VIANLQQEQVARTFSAEGPRKNLCAAPSCVTQPRRYSRRGSEPKLHPAYCLKTNGGPLTRFTLRSTVTSTRSAILTKGIPLFIP
jgi:hypothetical protein